MSAARTYLVPGLAVVTVAGDVTDLLRNSIEFQLGHFTTSPNAAVLGGLAFIKVEPYRRFVVPDGTVRFQDWRAVPGVVGFSPEGRHATPPNRDGFEILSD